MKRIKLNHGTAMVDDNCPQKTIDALNELSDRAFTMEYALVKDFQTSQNGIKCMTCGKTSYNQNDIKELYCGYCNKFHNDGLI